MQGSPIIKPTKDVADAIKLKTDNLPSDPADQSLIDAKIATLSFPGYTTSGVIVEDGSTGTPCLTYVASADGVSTWGNWTEIDASLSADSYICGLIASHRASWLNSFLVEIGVGAAGNESTIIRVTLGSFYNTSVGYVLPTMYPIVIPIKVSSGSRIAARMSTIVDNARSIYISVQYYQGL